MTTSPAGVHHADSADEISIRTIEASDIFDAIRLGIADFNAKPSHLFLLGLIYPIAGGLGAMLALGNDLLPLVLPIIGGYALMGPFVAVILYRISRRREQGRDFPWSEAFTGLTGRRSRIIIILGLMLFAVFVVWLLVALAIYNATLAGAYFSPVGLVREALSTSEGWRLIILGNGAGFLFAVFVLSSFVVSFPLALDRDVGPMTAIKTSLRVSFANPGPIALWGFIIVSSMIIGGLMLLVGLAVVLPVLGHASWHVYRKTVVPA